MTSGGSGGKQAVSTQVSRQTEAGTSATRRGEKRRIPSSMFQARTATIGSSSVFGGTKQTLG